MGYALLWTIVVALGTLGHLKTSGLTVRTKVGLAGRIHEVHTINIHEIVVEANRQRIGNSHEATTTVWLHIIFLAADIHNDLLGLWCVDAEISTALLVNLGELIAGNGILDSHSIGRDVNLLDSHW